MREFRGQRGFTLLEVMVSLVIVGGLLMTLIYTLNYNLGITERQFVITQITELAKQKLEEMENNPQESHGRFPAPYDALDFETKVKESSSFSEMLEIAVVVGKGNDRIALAELIRKPTSSSLQRGENR